MENPYLAMLRRVQSSSRSNTTTSKPVSCLADYGLDLVDCPVCENRGYIPYMEDGVFRSRECECMNRRRSIRRIERSDMRDMLRRYTFDSYQTPDAQRKRIKEAALRFADSDEGWFYIAGQSGSGKTHICTAICSALIERNKDVYYMRWRDESRKLKALVNSDSIDEDLERLKRIGVLYIDDFFKGGSSEADVRLAFEILNTRYNDTALRTIISSEIGIAEILEIDEAIGSRIYERSKGYCLQSAKDNWRLN